MCNDGQAETAVEPAERARIMRMRRDMIQSIRAQARIVNLAAADLGLPVVVVTVRRTTTGCGDPLDRSTAEE